MYAWIGQLHFSVWDKQTHPQLYSEVQKFWYALSGIARAVSQSLFDISSPDFIKGTESFFTSIYLKIFKYN